VLLAHRAGAIQRASDFDATAEAQEATAADHHCHPSSWTGSLASAECELPSSHSIYHVILRSLSSLLRPLRLTLALALLTSTVVVGVSSLSGSSVEAAVGGLATRYVPIAPIRVLDTRESNALQPKKSLKLNPIDTAVSAAIVAKGIDPTKVEAVAINVTAIDTLGPGFLTAWPTGSVQPNVSSLNYQTAGSVVPNLAIVPLGTGGMISIYSLSGTDLSVDVQGVFERADSSANGRFIPIVPDRAIDTRERNPIGAGKSIVVNLTGQIPATASAAVLNIAATETAGPGYLTVWADGEVRPNPAANLNYPTANYTVANSVITGVNAGKVRIFSLAGSDVIVDVVGYMTGSQAPKTSEGLYVPLLPQRLADSRPNKAPCRSQGIGAERTDSLVVAGELEVPSTGVSAVTMNLTMTNTLQAGFLEAFPFATKRPEPYSSVNAVRSGQTVGNHAVVALNAGKIDLFSSHGTDFVADITGYFLDKTGIPATAAATTPTPQAEESCAIPIPPANNDYEYLQAAGQDGDLAPYSRNGRKYFGWRPCESITYAVNTQRANRTQIDAMNKAIRQVENASGFDFVFLGDVNGSLNTNNIDANVPGVGQAMAVIGFSDSTATPILGGSVIGIGGIGSGSGKTVAQDGSFAWIVRGGFALADINDVTEPGDITATFAHELGHLVGLNHVSAVKELMRPVLSDQSDYGDGDRNGLYSIGKPQCSSRGTLESRTSAPLGTDPPASFTITGWIADEHIDH
jgi:hypothetical protein